MLIMGVKFRLICSAGIPCPASVFRQHSLATDIWLRNLTGNEHSIASDDVCNCSRQPMTPRLNYTYVQRTDIDMIEYMSGTQQNESRKRFPIGVQTFRGVRERDSYYVDKTPIMRDLIDQGSFYFLSRPRRFGKSLFVDTLKALFEGEEELFRGLAIHDSWDWSVRHPVVRLSFGDQYNSPEEIDQHIHGELRAVADDAGIEMGEICIKGSQHLKELIRLLHRSTGRQVVVLVDEYDKPILDALDRPELARANRDYLRGFYGIIKDSAEHVRFVFVTGITMFSKVSLFSGLNNLKDISLNPRYASICGFTDDELDTVFAPELEGLDREEIRRWYNGYSWLGEHRLYNPWDILNLLEEREFESHWFRSGTPNYLYRLIRERDYPLKELDGGTINKEELIQFDVGDIDLRALMFQSGYLTVGEQRRVGPDTIYTLEYPNFEVSVRFSEGLLVHAGRDAEAVSDDGNTVLGCLESKDFDRLAERLRTVYAAIPHDWYRNNSNAESEGHYLTVLQTYLQAVGADVQREVASSRGKADLVVKHAGEVYVIEAKVIRGRRRHRIDRALDAAMEQMRDRGYGDQYLSRGDVVHLVAMVFGSEERNLLDLRAESARELPESRADGDSPVWRRLRNVVAWR